MIAEVCPGSIGRKSKSATWIGGEGTEGRYLFYLPPFSCLPQWPSCRPMAAVTLLNLWNTQESKLGLPLLLCWANNNWILPVGFFSLITGIQKFFQHALQISCLSSAACWLSTKPQRTHTLCFQENSSSLFFSCHDQACAQCHRFHCPHLASCTPKG